MDQNKKPYKIEWVKDGITHSFPLPDGLLDSMREQLGIIPEKTLLANINLPIEELFIIPQTWGLQIIFEGNVVREWFIGECKMHCYFEKKIERQITKTEQINLHEFCLKLLKNNFPHEYGTDNKH